jgi:nitrite reductase/ring-hydroxylating ferredoxin subunit
MNRAPDQDDDVDEALRETFPASDPAANTVATGIRVKVDSPGTSASESRSSVATVAVGPLDQLQRDRFKVVSAGGRTILVVFDAGKVFALDNRCPHMGFPLHRGTVRDGILTCHWHHAKFDLASGCTLDPFADDDAAFAVEVRDGMVYLDPRPIESDRRAHWMKKVEEGLQQNLPLVLAKSVIGLDDPRASGDILKTAARFGITNRAAGWSAGLTILTAMANILPQLDPEDRQLALYQGLVHVARSTAGEPPDFELEPLGTTEIRSDRYVDWFRQFIDSRSADAAERTLRTAIRVGVARETVSAMVFAACTDHRYMDEGHTLDFANKAFELLDHIGWTHAETVLPSLVPNLVSASRAEERSSWRHPVDIPALLHDAFATLDHQVVAARVRLRDWNGHEELAERILDGEPAAILDTMCGLVRDGVPLTDLSAATAYAAARRLVHFHVANEFADWDTVHHTFTYANAVDRAMHRSPSNWLARGIFDAAMSIYLERFLNVPKQPVPVPTERLATAADLLAAFDIHGRVDESAQIVADLVASKRSGDVVRTLGHALLREDAGFHAFQVYEAGVSQYHRFADSILGPHVLIGTARFLAAHSPTVRAAGQTFQIARRLHRGENLYGDV